jgi:ethanolamine utilization protein EutA
MPSTSLQSADPGTPRSDENAGGRLFFTNARRSIVDEDEIRLLSVGIDIGSSTTHLAFSRITLERTDSRYIVSSRKILFESDILFTPYAALNTIDTARLQEFFHEQYRLAHIDFDEIDSGALILTGTAVRRRNARAIAELFAASAGKFVSISAGDGMEAILSAYGSGAVACSAKTGGDVLNIDIGGGTTKLARCTGGEIREVTAIDIGARLIAVDAEGCIIRLEPAGQKIAEDCGIALRPGAPVSEAELDTITERMSDQLMEFLAGGVPSPRSRALLRLDPLTPSHLPAQLIFSGGVAEYIYGRAETSHGDLGLRLAKKIAAKTRSWGPQIVPALQGIRATVIGASQYTVQVSGSTIFISEQSVLPLRNIQTVSPKFDLQAEHPTPEHIAARIREAIQRAGVSNEDGALALCYSWRESATFHRIDGFCRGVMLGLGPQLAQQKPLILIGDGDIGGLIGLHFIEELQLASPVISIDGISLKEFDFVDIGALLDGSGSVPVVIKSLIFPSTDGIGKVPK